MKIQSFRKVLAALAIAAGLSATIQADNNSDYRRHGGLFRQGGVLGTGLGRRDRRDDYWTDKSGNVVESPAQKAKDLRRNRRAERRAERRNYNR